MVLGLVKMAEGASGGCGRSPMGRSVRRRRAARRSRRLIRDCRLSSDRTWRSSPRTSRARRARGRASEDMLQLTLVCVAASAGERAPQTKRGRPMSITVGKLKLLCEKLFKVRAGAQRLFYKEPFQGMPELWSRTLRHRLPGVRDGASIPSGR